MSNGSLIEPSLPRESSSVDARVDATARHDANRAQPPWVPIRGLYGSSEPLHRMGGGLLTVEPLRQLLGFLERVRHRRDGGVPHHEVGPGVVRAIAAPVDPE